MNYYTIEQSKQSLAKKILTAGRTMVVQPATLMASKPSLDKLAQPCGN